MGTFDDINNILMLNIAQMVVLRRHRELNLTKVDLTNKNKTVVHVSIIS